MRNTTALAAADELDASSESQQLTDKNSGLLPLRQRRTSTHHLQPGGTLGPLGMPRRSARGSVSTRLPLTTHNTVHGDVEKKTEEAGYLVTEQPIKTGKGQRRVTRPHGEPRRRRAWTTRRAHPRRALPPPGASQRGAARHRCSRTRALRSMAAHPAASSRDIGPKRSAHRTGCICTEPALSRIVRARMHNDPMRTPGHIGGIKIESDRSGWSRFRTGSIG
ncbi:unnamed protein product [Prorocentrum cordatum]|uniref:Uncharacterized protein n=1 Tax=Prorocentrum cordatum TaxID=2364126 RepID=A0ABN9PZQ0_9DINO|nr:unnamed protein product [Polarella glacialis]